MPPTLRPQVTLTTAGALVLATAALGAVAASASPSMLDVRAYKPVADAYVTASAPRTNFGRARRLRVDGAPMTTTYLRFRLDELRGDPESATLLLHSNGSAPASYQVRTVYPEAWSERRVTYANAPSISSRYASSRPPVRRGRWSAVDVTAFVADDEVSLAITTRSPNGVSFGSRESRYGPRLAVRLRRDDDTGPDMLLERLVRK